MHTSTLTTSLLTVLFSCLSLSPAFAGTVNKIKGSKALIQLDGDSAQVGQEFYVLDSNGKRVALIRISQVKGNRAVGEVTKGAALLGGTIKAKVAPGEHSTPSEPRATVASSSASSLKRKKISGGVLAGYAMNSMKLTVQNPTSPLIKEDVTLTDSSFSAKVFADYDISPDFTVRVATGYESFAVKGSTAVAICSSGASKDCKVAFDYLTFEGSAHYNFLTGSTRAWVGLGYAYLLQMAKSLDVPNLSADGGQNQMILVSVGADFGLSGGAFIPVVIEHGMFPGSSNVAASALYARVGYGINF